MQPQANARRVSLAGHPGVYYRVGRDGRRRYEITFRDSTGVRRWRTIDGGLREADAALRSVHHRQDRGERVVATTATLAEVAAAYIAAQTEIRPRTREKYETGLRVHVLPRLGRRRVASITTDDIAGIVAAMRDEGRAGWTIRGVLVPLSRVFAYAVRRGYLAVNPVSALERSERPKVGKRAKRVLSADQIRLLLDAATLLYRPILALAVYTGLRQSECLGLHWRDVDFDAGFIRVRAQLDRSGERVEPKTAEAVRDVVLAPALGRMLRAHRLASHRSGDGDFVFVNEAGRPFNARNVQARGFDRAARITGLDEGAERKATFHDLRRTFGSMLIAAGADVVHVSKQLGHADPAITLRVYADEFAVRDNADRTRAMLDMAAATTLGL